MTETRFRQKHTAFSMTCRVTLRIHADPERVWRLLTDAKDFPRRNSTVAGIEGQIGEGERLRLRVPGTGRMFHSEGFRCRAKPTHELDWRIRPSFQGRPPLHPAAPRGGLNRPCNGGAIFRPYVATGQTLAARLRTDIRALCQ